MKKRMWKCIISGITAATMLLSPMNVIAEEDSFEPASEEEILLGVDYSEEDYFGEEYVEESVIEDSALAEELDEIAEEVIDEYPDDAIDEIADGVLEEKTETLEAAEETSIPIDEEHFPDENFRTILSTIQYDSNEDGLLSEDEIADITDLYVPECNISSLDGLEYLSYSTSLFCYGNQLTSLDLSKNTALQYVECEDNQLTSLDVSGCIALMNLHCENNQLMSLDVSGCTTLRYLDCAVNQLTNLEVSGCTTLRELVCYNNQLTSLDVSKNEVLKVLDCNSNQLTSLDVSKNTAMMELYCGVNQLSILDVSNNTALEDLWCEDNQLTSLDVSKNTALYYLVCGINQLTTLDVSKNTALGQLYCYFNQLTSLDVSKNIDLGALVCYGNQLTSLDVSKNSALAVLSCCYNMLTSLDISNCPTIKETYINGEHSSESGVETYTIYDEEDEDRSEVSWLYIDSGVAVKTGATTEHTHTFGAWTVTVPATEDSEGLQVRTCSGCGQTETATVPRVAVNFTISKTPSGVKAKAAAKGKATITWKKFKQTKKTKAIWKKIKKVEVQYSTDPTFKTKISKLVGKAKTKLAVKGLLKNTTYYVRTRYTDGAGGYSKWSGTKKFKTKK